MALCVPTESRVDDANQADDGAELTRKFNKVCLHSLMLRSINWRLPGATERHQLQSRVKKKKQPRNKLRPFLRLKQAEFRKSSLVLWWESTNAAVAKGVLLLRCLFFECRTRVAGTC